MLNRNISIITFILVTTFCYSQNKDAKYYFEQGDAKYDLEDYRGAISDYNKAIELNPKYADAYFNRGTAKGNLEDHRGAISDYNKAIELNPQSAVAYNNRGNAKQRLQ